MIDMDISGIFSESFWYIAPIIMVATTALSGLINQGLNIAKSWIKQLISWVIASGLSVVAYYTNVIEFGEPVWLSIVMLCIVTSLASNGIYDIPTIRNFINKWFNKGKS